MATASLSLKNLGTTRPGVLYPRAQWYFLLAMATTWLGFSRSYFAVIRTEPLLHHVHGVLMGGWIALLVVQPMLYQANRMRLHRRLGRWGVYLLVPGIVVCGFLMLRGMLRTTALPRFIVDQLAFLDVCSLILFPVFVGLSIWFGRNLHLHARYMVATVLLMMPPATTRAFFILPFMRSFQRNVNVSMALMDLILLALMVDDARRGKVRTAYPVALVCTTVVGVAANFAHHWSWWHALTAWIARS